jgi:DNA-binding NarL/FixJ family response regulator
VPKILIAEKHPVERYGIHELLAGRRDWEIVGDAHTGRQALELARRARPEVVVVDLSLPEVTGVDAIRQLRAEAPEIGICAFSTHEDEELVADAFAAGARAFVLKAEPGTRLLEAIDALSRGEPFFSTRVAGLVVSALVRARAGDRPEADPLTPREREVAQLLAEGVGSRAVASRLGITAKTVDTHRAAIMRKLGMSSMADLVRYAIRHRMVEP